MPISNMQMPHDNYDSRWFIWTIVFLVVTGISLVSYIALSGNTTDDSSGALVVHHAAAKKPLTK